VKRRPGARPSRWWESETDAQRIGRHIARAYGAVPLGSLTELPGPLHWTALTNRASTDTHSDPVAGAADIRVMGRSRSSAKQG
jgi:hypothetical protein